MMSTRINVTIDDITEVIKLRKARNEKFFLLESKIADIIRETTYESAVAIGAPKIANLSFPTRMLVKNNLTQHPTPIDISGALYPPVASNTVFCTVKIDISKMEGDKTVSNVEPIATELFSKSNDKASFA